MRERKRSGDLRKQPQAVRWEGPHDAKTTQRALRGESKPPVRQLGQESRLQSRERVSGRELSRRTPLRLSRQGAGRLREIVRERGRGIRGGDRSPSRGRVFRRQAGEGRNPAIYLRKLNWLTEWLESRSGWEGRPGGSREPQTNRGDRGPWRQIGRRHGRPGDRANGRGVCCSGEAQPAQPTRCRSGGSRYGRGNVERGGGAAPGS